MTVGDRIRQVRLEQDVTQQELADYIGVSKQAVYKYENNIVTNIPTDKVDAIARRLKVSPAYLMGWEEQPTPKPTSASVPMDYAKGDWLQMFAADPPKDKTALLDAFDQLNAEGRQKAVEYTEDLVLTGRYKKD